MSGALQLWLIAVDRPGVVLHQFHSAVMAVSNAPAVQTVPAASYLWIPIAVGVGLAALLVLLTGIFGVPYVDHGVAQTAYLLSRRFWRARFYASAGWTFGGSGATTITTLATALAAILASGNVLTSIFPTIDLNPFIIMNVACGGIVAAAPILFALANVVVMRGSPAVPVNAMLTLWSGATITAPTGASIALPGGATVRKANDGPEKARIKASATIMVPPSCRITIKSGATMALSSAAVAISPGATLTMDTATRIASGDLAPPQTSQTAGHQGIWDWPSGTAVPDPHMTASDLITLTEGAVATVTGAADIYLPGGAAMVAPGRRGTALRANTTFTVPLDPNVRTAAMGSVLPAAALTILGIGAEIGLIAVLAAHYSAAGHAGRVAAVVISAVVAAGVVLYGATGVQSLADPSSGAGTSFTL
jgi:hypothetical protein